MPSCLLTDCRCARIQTVFNKLFGDGAQVNDDLTRLDLVYLINALVRLGRRERHQIAYRAGLNGLDCCHVHPMMSTEEKLARVSLNAWVCQDRGEPVDYDKLDPSMDSMTPLMFYLRCKDIIEFGHL